MGMIFSDGVITAYPPCSIAAILIDASAMPKTGLPPATSRTRSRFGSAWQARIKASYRSLPARTVAISSMVESFTHGRIYQVIVSKKFLGPQDKVLIVDDFLANGAALEGLIDIVAQSGAQLAGAGIVIEKAFQPGGDRLRAQGVRVESLARVKAMSEENGVEFAD